MKRIGLGQKFLFTLFLFFLQTALFAQADSIKNSLLSPDSLAQTVDSVAEANKLKSAINADTLVPFVANKLERYGWQIHSSNRLLKDMLDLGSVTTMVNMMGNGLDKTQKRMNQKGRKMNLQSINTSIIILEQSQDAAQEKLDALNTLYSQLLTNNSGIKDILKDPIFKLEGITDTSLVTQLQDLKVESEALDSSEMINIANANYMRSKLSTLTLRIRDLLSDLRYMESNQFSSMWKKDELPLVTGQYGYVCIQ